MVVKFIHRAGPPVLSPAYGELASPGARPSEYVDR